MGLGPGKFRVAVTKAYMSAARKKGTPCVVVEVVFAEGERMQGNIWLPTRESKPTAAPFARRQLEAIGFDVDHAALNDMTLAACESAECDVTLDIEEYNGKRTLKIQSFGQNAEPTEEDIENALGMMRSARDDKEVKPLPKGTAQAPRPQGPPDDYNPPAPAEEPAPF